MYILKSGPDHELHHIRAHGKDSGNFFLFITNLYTYKYLFSYNHFFFFKCGHTFKSYNLIKSIQIYY